MTEILIPHGLDEQLLRVGRAAATALEATLREVPARDGRPSAEDLLEALAPDHVAAAVLRPRPEA